MEYIIVLAPLLGSIIAGFFGKQLGSKLILILSSCLVLVSAILSLFLFYQTVVNDYSSNNLIFNWITSGNLNVN